MDTIEPITTSRGDTTIVHTSTGTAMTRKEKHLLLNTSLGQDNVIASHSRQYWHGKQSDLIRNVKAHYGLLLHRVIGDGNCLYTAFAIVLEHNCEIMTDWKILRKEVFIIAIHYYNYYHNYYYLFICSPCRL